MEFILHQVHKVRAFGWLYLANLMVGFHFYSVQFINSNFLSTFFDTTAVGLLYTIASALGLLLVGSAGIFLSILGNVRTALLFATLDLSAMLTLATATDPAMLVVAFCLHTCMVPVVLFTLDVFLEQEITEESTTGNVRGLFLSVATIAALFAPMIAGYIAGEEGAYAHVYLFSAFFLLPLLCILALRVRRFVDPPYRTFSPVRTLRAAIRNPDILRIASAQFLMRFFFAWNVIFLPLYLHTQIGFTLPEIGAVLFIMLLPYVFVELPAGIVADSWLGEKELLLAGFLLVISGTIGMYFLTTPSIALWGGVLFLSRIGLALIESMTETYFFKKIQSRDTDLLALFRILRPLAYTVGPVIATGVLMLTDIRHLWLVLAGIMLIGVYHGMRLKDTK
ncbi:MAG: MFS transporter [Candidatus Pacebacteria bacterium]|nr:MFS transporter [Candidatus Paceibacterota bacterium]